MSALRQTIRAAELQVLGRELSVRQSDQSGALDRIKAIDGQIAMLRLVL
jgi:hypothetical protein